MIKFSKKILVLFAALLAAVMLFTACGSSDSGSSASGNSESSSYSDSSVTDESSISEDGTYTSKDEVALYIHTYNHLPSNYITKNEAKDLGWDSSKGNLWEVTDGKSIGGDYFGNYEGLLPDDTEYHECDIDYEGGSRNAKRIIYGDDGSIYYTEDHYESFEQLY